MMYIGGPPPNPFKADARAVAHRVRTLAILLDAAKQLPEYFPDILRENPVPDVLFHTIADIPMTYEMSSKVNRGWTFEPQEFYRRIGVD